jgi:hypothetical protein
VQLRELRDRFAKIAVRSREKAARRGDAVQDRHAQVHEDDVGLQRERQRQRFLAIARLADDFDVGVGVE